MPPLTAPALTLPPKSFPGTQGAPSGIAGEMLFSAMMGKYSTLVKQGKVQQASAITTAMVIFSTAASTGGPIIWNKPGSGIDAHILGIGVSLSVASSVSGAIGLTGNVGQTVLAVGTAIDFAGNCLVGGPASGMGTIARLATPTNAGNFFMPLFQVGTAATSAQFITTFVDVAGSVIIPPGGWGSVAGSATLTTMVAHVALIWAELPA